jgi:2-polyprenyl-3-methyl-5-hydroxy-6-metoxy-1,4-benzoquinol methylase
MKSVLSPLSNTHNTIKIKTITTQFLMQQYRRYFDIDIAHLLPDGVAEISLYQCLDTGYKFYDPLSVVGDSDFYHKLQINDWYYLANKWEFEESIKHFAGGNILEIGSGCGDFLKLVQNSDPRAQLTGLELNKDAASAATDRGLDVRVQSLGDHVQDRQEYYDAVVSFQVLEHIPSPRAYLLDALKALKVGGKLIIGVPDNSERAFQSILGLESNILNMPPHHQGLWDIPSLAHLTKFFPLYLNYLAVEPSTSSHHSNSYRGLMKADLKRRFGSLLGFAIYLIGRPYYDHALHHMNKYLPAHSILGVYTKLAQ